MNNKSTLKFSISCLRCNDKGQVVLAMLLMLILSAAGLIVISLLGRSTIMSASGVLNSKKAQHIARAGMNWYIRTILQDPANQDWSLLDPGSPEVRAFGSGIIYVIPANDQATRNKIDILAGGLVPGEQRNYTHVITCTVRKLPSVFSSFAYYLGEDRGNTHHLYDTNTVNGDTWTAANEIVFQSTVNGTGYVAQGNTLSITSGSVGNIIEVDNPPDHIPAITNDIYRDRMDVLSSQMDTYDATADWSGVVDEVRTTDLNLTVEGPLVYNNFTARNNIKITGSGRITAAGNINLATSILGLGVTVEPDPGGVIELFAQGNILCGDAGPCNINGTGGNVILYSRSQNGAGPTNSFVRFIWFTAQVNGALILARRRILVQFGADISNSELYVDDFPGAATTNVIDVNGAGTNIDNSSLMSERWLRINTGADVSNSELYVANSYLGNAENNYLQVSGAGTTADGVLISLSPRADEGMAINGGATISGLIYYGGTSDMELVASTVNGSLATTQFSWYWATSNCSALNTINFDLDEVYDAADLLGNSDIFDGYASIEPDSWQEY